LVAPTLVICGLRLMSSYQRLSFRMIEELSLSEFFEPLKLGFVLQLLE
jgi:hypothetical protein